MDRIRKEYDINESEAIVINGLEVNALTGLYLSHTFFQKAEEFLKSVDGDGYCVLAIDLEHFRLFNKIYSREQGDELLKRVAEKLKEYRINYGGVIGYFGGDNFAILTQMDMDRFRDFHRAIAKEVACWSNTVGFLPAFGVYPITDTAIDIATMYDRATMALKKIVGNYSQRHCIYSEDMEEKEEEELRLLSEIQSSLKNQEFTFYVQPQCDIATGKIVGGECLVRWIHPEKGLISPGIFIPVLEKNGFIASLDRYVWEKVCEWLRSLIDRGFQPVPVSINVSRIDIYSMDVPGFLLGLLEKYQLPSDLLKVEITESTYVENNDKVIRAVKQLRDAKLWVMMDDFGSGYSSLNMLRSVAVDVLKLDMRFLEIKDTEEEKGIGILESVVNMARQMQLPIIVEGVENQKQESFLLKMGCRYSQGYYYYRPMPIADFEELIKDVHNLDKDGIWCKRVEALHMSEFLDRNIFNDTLLNNILGPAAFYDMYENNIKITRVNNQYYELLGGNSKTVESDNPHKSDFLLHVNEEDREKILRIFKQAGENQNGEASEYIHFVRLDGRMLWVRISIHFLREQDGHRIYYGSLLDLTDLQEKKEVAAAGEYDVEELTERQWRHIEKYYGEFPRGCILIKPLLDENHKVRDCQIIYANKEIGRITGENVDRMQFRAAKAFAHRREELFDKMYRTAYLGEKFDIPIYSVLSKRYLKLVFTRYQKGYVCCVMEDETKVHMCEASMNQLVQEYKEVYYVHLQENFGRMLYPDNNHLMEQGKYEESIEVHLKNGTICPEDAEIAKEFFDTKHVLKEFETKDQISVEYRRKGADDTWEWCRTSIRVCDRINGVPMSGLLTVKKIQKPE